MGSQGLVKSTNKTSPESGEVVWSLASSRLILLYVCRQETKQVFASCKLALLKV
jgi:hypothetical protein